MYSCECGYESNAKFNLKRHQQSKTHLLNMRCLGENLVADANGYYTCVICDFTTCRKNNYRKHVLSEKHASIKGVANSAVVAASPLQTSSTSAVALSNDLSKPVMLLEVMEMFLTHQTHQQTEILKTFADRIMASQNHVLAAAPTVHNSFISAGNMNNTKFNLNLFLNEECKNAMNMSDFINNVVVTMEDLEHLGEVGYTEGMSKILTKAIRSTETSERPLHCTDVKRETIYVRKDDVWKKDEDCEETKRLIQHISHKNYKALAEWREQHPDYVEPDTADYEAWYSISRNMCNTDPSALKKLIRHLALTTAVEKSQSLVMSST